MITEVTFFTDRNGSLFYLVDKSQIICGYIYIERERQHMNSVVVFEFLHRSSQKMPGKSDRNAKPNPKFTFLRAA